MIASQTCFHKDMRVTSKGREQSNDRRELFVRELWQALAHLYDPGYHPGQLLQEQLDVSNHDEMQRVLIQAVKDCAPDPDIPPAAAVSRLYALLRWRYLEVVTQEEVAERLNLSVRHVRREQRRAIRMIAEHLLTAREASHADATQTSRQAGDWISQVKQELALLQESGAPGVCDLGQVLRGVLPVAQLQAGKKGIRLVFESNAPELSVAIHPTALRQVFLISIRRIVQQMNRGSLLISARQESGDIVIELAPSFPLAQLAPRDRLVDEILTASGGEVAWVTESGRSRLAIRVPAAQQWTVLVVDDNPDLVHLYRRYASQTPYRIVHTAVGDEVFASIAEWDVDIVVLDVMLPDTDGWDLLTRLRQLPETRHIPVIVSTVLREQELASALGAQEYLVKPVRRQDFVAALDRVSSRVRT